MRDPSTIAILWAVAGACAVSTAAIFYYARFVLPARMERRMQQSVQAFGTAIELRFPSHRGLTERVARLSTMVGRKLGLGPARMRRLQMAAQLRDVGLCAIPYGLVNRKSTFHWDDADWATYFRHAEVSGAMLELVPSLRDLATIVRFHHTSYRRSPELIPGGDDLPIESRILRVVCEYVWLTRLQGSLLALDSIKRGRDDQFDPRVVDALVQVLTSSRADSSRSLIPV